MPILMILLIIFKYFVLMSVKSRSFCITLIRVQAPPELAHVKNRLNKPNISKSYQLLSVTCYLILVF